jgi:dephospho-CoA kinase
MVILIGGVSCTGKTVMAQKLLEKYKIPYLSIDNVKMGLIRGKKHFDSGIVEHRSEIEQKGCDDYMNRDNFIKLHSKLKELCKDNNAKFFEINDDNENICLKQIEGVGHRLEIWGDMDKNIEVLRKVVALF